jgi:SAM-dependent methyltransferase
LKCRHCGNELNLLFLDLGSAPPSNAYLSKGELAVPEVWFPLRILVCDSCWLVQTEDHAGREALFTKDYAYFSSVSTTWLAHAEEYVAKMIKRFGLTTDSLVIEVAANDGYLLQFVQQAAIPCIGIEPTSSTACAARNKNIQIVEQFFGNELAEEMANRGLQADLMVANNVLAHVPDINDFVSGFSRLLKPDGVVTFEFPHLLRMVQKNQFDTVYHEHYSYLSLTAVKRILEFNRLMVFDVEELGTHGGSLRVFSQCKDTGLRIPSDKIGSIINMERVQGVSMPGFYMGFQEQAEKIKDDLLEALIEAKRKGLRVAAYGAAAKGNTLINFAGIRPDLIPYVADRNAAKEGRYMPGSHIPIVGESVLQADRPDIILILPWNLRDEIMSQLSYALEWGAKFITAIPELRYYGDCAKTCAN